jgi:hypothetical protein
LTALLTPELQAQAARFTQLKVQLAQPKRFVKWVGKQFWAEVKNTFPALADYPKLMLCSDWSIVEDTDHSSHSFEDLLEGLAARRTRRAA